MPLIAIIADDLTGACDAGVQLAAAGYLASAVIDASCLPSALSKSALAVNTGSRDLEAREAAARVRDTARALLPCQFEHYYKKVDSLLRGSVFAEIAACMEVLGPDYCLLAPAYPDNGRILAGGEILVTDAGGKTRRIPVNLDEAARFGVRAEHISLADVALGPAHLASVISEHVGKGPVVLLADAAENAHLEAIADAIRLVPRRCLPAGSAGLIKYMLPHWPHAAAPMAARKPGRHGSRILIIVGSIHPATLAQADFLRGRPGYAVYDMAGAPDAIKRDMQNLPGTVVLISSPAQSAASAPDMTYARGLGQIAREVFGPLGAGALILTGGETAYSVLDALGLRVIDLEDEPLEGVAAGWAEGILVITKSGGFGGAEALHALAVYAAKRLGIHQDNT